MRSPCFLCICESGCLYACESLNQSLLNFWNLHHGTWTHFNGVLHKSLPPVCVHVCASLISLLGNDSVNTYPRQRRIVGGVVFYAVHVVSKESRRLVILRISCYLLIQHYWKPEWHIGMFARWRTDGNANCELKWSRPILKLGISQTGSGKPSVVRISDRHIGIQMHLRRLWMKKKYIFFKLRFYIYPTDKRMCIAV
jgi:hypothetical protein